jgi:hypothetical protein
MLARLGDVLYWLGCVIAALLLVFAGLIATTEGDQFALKNATVVAVAAVLAVLAHSAPTARSAGLSHLHSP